MKTLWFALCILVTGSLSSNAAAISASAQVLTCSEGLQQVQIAQSDLTVCWRISAEGLDVEAIHPGSVWIGVGFGHSMSQADAIIGYHNRKQGSSVGPIVVDSHMTGRLLETINDDVQQDIENGKIEVINGVSRLSFSRPLVTQDINDYPLDITKPIPFLWAVGDGKGFSFHSDFGVLQLDLINGVELERELPFLMVIHAAMMILAWAIMSPIVVIITRYFKVTPRQPFPRALDNKFWWYSHWITHSSVIVLTVIAIALAAIHLNGFDLTTLHAKLGVAICLLALFQASMGIARGSKGGPFDDNGHPQPRDKWAGDHYDMTMYRHLFEKVHKTSGYLTIMLAHLAIYTGLFLFAMPIWSYLALFALEALIFSVGALFALQHRWVDTYHAIWGYNPIHPGNRRNHSK